MTLEDLGYSSDYEKHRKEHQLDAFEVGRIIAEHKERYMVNSGEQEYEGEIIGNLRFTAQSRADFPAVGDWVAISPYDNHKVLIHAVFPRKTIIERQSVGKQGEKQIIATNIDYAFIVQAVDRDFNINRIERYLTICNTAKVIPMIILTKTDLISKAELEDLNARVKERVREVPVILISNETREGIEELKKEVIKAKTYCLLGSSGVGKSTLLNNLSGQSLMKTNTISESTNKGRHVTTHRELIVLDNGGILIDNPGMREVGIADSAPGLEKTFEHILDLSAKCKFKDCTHISEIGCAVLAALEEGALDENAYENYQKMEREKSHFESTISERRKKDKDFGKMVKNFKQIKKLK